MIKKNELRINVEKYFEMLKFEYEILEFEDDDLNYEITFPVDKELKPLSSMKGILFLGIEDHSLNFIMPNIYNFSEDDNIQDFYKIINETNMEDRANFVIYEKEKCIFYRDRIICGEDFKILNENLIRFLIENCKKNVIALFNNIIKYKNRDK